MASGREFHSRIVRSANGFWYSVDLQRGTRNLCCVTVTGLSFKTRSRLSVGTATCSLSILYRKASLLTRLRSSKGSGFSSCYNPVTLVDQSYVFVIQRAALLWIRSSESMSLIRCGFHIRQPNAQGSVDLVAEDSCRLLIIFYKRNMLRKLRIIGVQMIQRKRWDEWIKKADVLIKTLSESKNAKKQAQKTRNDFKL